MLRKAVSDRRAPLDKELDVRPAISRLVDAEFERGAGIPVVLCLQTFEKNGWGTRIRT
jgi:hypothetical protein